MEAESRRNRFKGIAKLLRRIRQCYSPLGIGLWQFQKDHFLKEVSCVIKERLFKKKDKPPIKGVCEHRKFKERREIRRNKKRHNESYSC